MFGQWAGLGKFLFPDCLQAIATLLSPTDGSTNFTVLSAIVAIVTSYLVEHLFLSLRMLVFDSKREDAAA